MRAAFAFAALGLVACATSEPARASGPGLLPVGRPSGGGARAAASVSADTATIWNVKLDCGATGDGTTDDTATIRTCIAYCAASSVGGVVLFPAGTYKVDLQPGDPVGSDPILEIPSNCTFRGEGQGATTIRLPTDYWSSHDSHPADGTLDDDHYVIGSYLSSAAPTTENLTVEKMSIEAGFPDSATSCRASAEHTHALWFYAATPKLNATSIAAAVVGDNWTSFVGGGGVGSCRPMRITQTEAAGSTLSGSYKLTGTCLGGGACNETTATMSSSSVYETTSTFCTVTKLEVMSIANNAAGDTVKLNVARPIENVVIRDVTSGNSGGDSLYVGIGVHGLHVIGGAQKSFCRGGTTVAGAATAPIVDVSVSGVHQHGHPGSTKFRGIDIEPSGGGAGNSDATSIRVENSRIVGGLEVGRCNECKVVGGSVQGYVAVVSTDSFYMAGTTVSAVDQDGIQVISPATGLRLVDNAITYTDSACAALNHYGILLYNGGTGEPSDVVIRGNSVTSATTACTAAGIRVETGTHVNVSENRVTGAGWTNGIICDGCDTGTIVRNIVSGPTNALQIATGYGAASNVVVRDNVLSGATRDLYVNPAACADLVNVSVSENRLVNGTRLSAGSCATDGEAVLTIADNGAGTPALDTTSPASMTRHELITCNDANGCTRQPGETNAKRGDRFLISNRSANTVTITDSAGIVRARGGSLALSQYDTAECVYEVDQWACR